MSRQNVMQARAAATRLADPTQLITYSQTTASGRTFRCSRRTAAHLDYTKKRLEQLHPGARLVIIQGCYNQGVELSKGTHDYDAVLDVMIVGLDWWAAQQFLRACGWAAWYRHTGAWASSSSWHIHMVSLGYVARVGIYVPGQVDDYYRHTFGLKDQHNTDLDKSWFPGDDGPAPWLVGTPEQWRAAIDATIFDFALWERELEDNMPFTDWPKTDQTAMATAVAGEVVKQLLAAIVDGGRLTVGQAIRQASNVPGKLRRLASALHVDLDKEDAEP